MYYLLEKPILKKTFYNENQTYCISKSLLINDNSFYTFRLKKDVKTFPNFYDGIKAQRLHYLLDENDRYVTSTYRLYETVLVKKENNTITIEVVDDPYGSRLGGIGSIVNYLNLFINLKAIKKLPEITVENFDKHVSCLKYKITKEEYLNNFVENLKMYTYRNADLKDYRSEFNFEEILFELNTLERLKDISLLSITRGHQAYRNIINLAFYAETKDFLLYDTNANCEISNSRISCGVSQLSNIDNILPIMNEYSKEQKQLFFRKFREVLKNYSKGSTIIYSTTQQTRKAYKEELNLLNEGFSETTRYAYNNNSGNKIGTTILIVR